MRTLNERYTIVPSEQPRVGGMSEICRAIDMVDGQKPVAVKLFKSNLESDRLHLLAYSNESKALQCLVHPNIVRILDGGVEADSGRRFFVLEWLETSLTEHIRRHPLDGWDSFYEQIGKPILDALAYAYGKGILHRDLKPQNVLFSPEGVIKVADFGIAKIKSIIAPGLTLAQFRSEPYAPPEPDDGRYTDTRDVYSFAVLSLECLSDDPVRSYEDVYRCLAEFNGPDEIEHILKSALSREPETRPKNILDLKSRIDAVQTKRELDFGLSPQKRRCNVMICGKLPEKLGRLLDQAGLDYKKVVIDDLNEICGFRRSEPRMMARGRSAAQEGMRLTLYTAQYLYEAVVDLETRGFLRLVDCFSSRPSNLDFQRESCWMPDMEFSIQRSSHVTQEAIDTISWMMDGLVRHESDQEQRELAIRSERLFKTWMAILHAKSDLETHRESPIPYDGIDKRGSRLILFTDVPLDDELIGQPRLIEVSLNHVIAGEVESIGNDHLVLWVESGATDGIPQRGKLQFDTRAGRVAIQRQRQAVDAIRFRRASRPELRDLLIDPQKALPPSDVNEPDFFQDLDQSKREAVIKALGSDSFLIVEGPPGTGKTRFITELVLQTLRRTPGARILLTSQTHVALDNALEAIRLLNRNLKLVRIGRRHDERVSKGVSDLLLENGVDAWLERVKKHSEVFLESHARCLGVDRLDISLGMAAERLRTALEGVQLLQENKAKAEKELAQLSEQERKRAAARASESFQELRQYMRETSESIGRLELELEVANRRVDLARKSMSSIRGGEEIATASPAELVEWEEVFLRKDEPTCTIHRLAALAEEWFLRFGRSRDFFAAFIADCEVVAGTCLGYSSIRGIQTIDFDLCIVDEASKATVTELLVPLSRARKWVLVGDRNQLPPFVDDALEDESLLAPYDVALDDLKSTLLEMLADHLPKACVASLIQQHRMIRPIGDLVNHCFYDGRLESVNVGDPVELQLAMIKPTTWFSTSSLPNHKEQQDCQSYKNFAEVSVIRNLLKRLNFIAIAKAKRYSIAVLTGYASQKLELRRAIDVIHDDINSLDIECNTIDAFQGREADVAIYSITRSNDRGDLGFLRDRRRVNVALSRGRIGLAIVGDMAFARSAAGYNPWSKVLDYIESHPLYCAIYEVKQ
jgi:serine/threonine protein kinase